MDRHTVEEAINKASLFIVNTKPSAAANEVENILNATNMRTLSINNKAEIVLYLFNAICTSKHGAEWFDYINFIYMKAFGSVDISAIRRGFYCALLGNPRSKNGLIKKACNNMPLVQEDLTRIDQICIRVFKRYCYILYKDTGILDTAMKSIRLG